MCLWGKSSRLTLIGLDNYSWVIIVMDTGYLLLLLCSFYTFVNAQKDSGRRKNKKHVRSGDNLTRLAAINFEEVVNIQKTIKDLSKGVEVLGILNWKDSDPKANEIKTQLTQLKYHSYTLDKDDAALLAAKSPLEMKGKAYIYKHENGRSIIVAASTNGKSEQEVQKLALHTLNPQDPDYVLFLSQGSSMKVLLAEHLSKLDIKRASMKVAKEKVTVEYVDLELPPPDKKLTRTSKATVSILELLMWMVLALSIPCVFATAAILIIRARSKRPVGSVSL